MNGTGDQGTGAAYASVNALIVIQARLGATRLPGKVLKKIGDLTVLEHVYRRASLAGTAFVASTVGDYHALSGRGVPIVGVTAHEDDVLGRIHHACRECGKPSHVVRITADCPFIRPDDIRAVVGGLVLSGADYAWNVGEPRECPDGYDVEAFTWDALERANDEATDSADREHVTTWMRRNLHCVYVPTHTGMGRYRWTLDTAEDLAWMQDLAKYVFVTPGVGPTQDHLVMHFEMLNFPKIDDVARLFGVSGAA